MTTTNTASRIVHHAWPTVAKTLAVCLALIAVSYGVVEMADHPLTLQSDAAASLPKGSVPYAEPQPGARSAAMATSESLNAVRTGKPADRTDSDRECAPEKGINTSCIFE